MCVWAYACASVCARACACACSCAYVCVLLRVRVRVPVCIINTYLKLIIKKYNPSSSASFVVSRRISFRRLSPPAVVVIFYYHLRLSSRSPFVVVGLSTSLSIGVVICGLFVCRHLHRHFCSSSPSLTSSSSSSLLVSLHLRLSSSKQTCTQASYMHAPRTTGKYILLSFSLFNV